MIEINTYKDLEYYFNMFKLLKPNLMFVVSRGGLGKTTFAENMLKGVKFIRGHTTPLAFYRELCESQGETLQLVLDDIDLFKSSVMIGLIKQATDTKDKQTLSYNSTHQVAEMLNKEVCKKISTLILLNKANLESNPDLAAIKDRGHYVFFNPTNEEIFKYGESVGLGSKVLNCVIKQFCQFSLNFSLRTFVKCSHHLGMGEDWKGKVLAEMSLHPKLAEIIKLQEKYKTVNEQIENYSASKSDFHRWKIKLKCH